MGPLFNVENLDNFQKTVNSIRIIMIVLPTRIIYLSQISGGVFVK